MTHDMTHDHRLAHTASVLALALALITLAGLGTARAEDPTDSEHLFGPASHGTTPARLDPLVTRLRGGSQIERDLYGDGTSLSQFLLGQRVSQEQALTPSQARR